MRYLPLLLLVFLLLPLASAAEFDNEVKPIDAKKSQQIGDRLVEKKEIWTKYAPIEIKNAFGFGSTLATGALETHTESCGASDCSSMFTLATTETSVLVQDIAFWRMNSDESARLFQEPIRGYQLYLMTSETPRIVQKTKLVCVPINYINGSSSTSCTSQPNGTRIEYDRTWEPYVIGASKKAGTYTLRLDGQKKPDKAIDWVIKTQGKWLDEWSTWGTAGYGALVTDFSFALGSTAGGTCEGYQIITKKTLIITNMTMVSGGGGSYCKLVTGFGGSVIDSGVVSGTNCPLLGNITLTANTKYVVCADNDKYGAVPVTTGTNINTTGLGCYTSGPTANCNQGNIANQGRAIASITSREFTNVSSITLINPANNTGSTSRTYSPFNATASVVGATLVNMSYWDNSTGVFTRNKTTTLTGAINGTNFTQVFAAEGSYLWGIQACDTDGACGMSENRTISIDGTAPGVSLIYPLGLIPFAAAFQNITLNYSFTGTPQACSYTYDGVNRALNCTGNSTMVLGTPKNLTLTANDSAGNTNTTFFSWNYTLFQSNVSFNATTTETATEGYIWNGTYTASDWLSVTVVQWFNNSQRTATLSSLGGQSYATSSGVVPVVVNGSAYPFFWQFAFTNTSGTTYINTSSNTQTVNKIYLINCNATVNYTVINFTSYNSTSPFTKVNATFSALLVYGLSGATLKQNYSYLDTSGFNSSFQFCTNIGNQQIDLDADIQYDAPSFAQNYFYYRNRTIINTTTIQQPLYLLSESMSTLTSFEVVDNLQNGVPNTLISIYSVELGTNTERLVSMIKTNYNGKDVSYLNWYETLYHLKITNDDNTILQDLEPYKISVTPQRFVLLSSTGNVYDKFRFVTSNLTFNNVTNTFVVTFNDPNNAITGGCLRIIRGGLTNYSIISDQCLNATSGTISYVLTQGNGTFYAVFYATGSWDILKTMVAYVGAIHNAVYNTLGNLDASTLAFILVGTVGFIGLFSASGAVIMLMVGYGIGYFMGLIPMDSAMNGAFISLIIVGGLIAWYSKN